MMSISFLKLTKKTLWWYMYRLGEPTSDNATKKSPAVSPSPGRKMFQKLNSLSIGKSFSTSLDVSTKFYLFLLGGMLTFKMRATEIVHFHAPRLTTHDHYYPLCILKSLEKFPFSKHTFPSHPVTLWIEKVMSNGKINWIFGAYLILWKSLPTLGR